ncbi:substrate import-associated zinc metallohydrolase lipoprotein [Chitinophaga lutea]
MKLKHILYAGLGGLLLVGNAACRKSEKLDVDMSRYTVDNPVESELDKWITTSLTDPYNIQLVYKYDRNLTDVSRDVSPIKLDKVQPTVNAILDIFLKTYEKVAGPTFIKTYTPKQFVLYGSPSYNSNGTITLGTAEGGRKVVLYELNDLNFTDAQQVARKMRTIHHEFTHIVNQIVAIPPEFRKVTDISYDQDWTNSANTAALAQSLGFVSRYARSQYGEDFAEMTAHLLVEGQLWFDAYAKAAGADGQAKLKRKEALVVDYFRQYFNINFRELQFEVAAVLREKYNDISRTFLYALRNTQLANPLVVDLANGQHYTDYGQSAQFKAVWEATKTALGASGRVANNFQIVFKSPTEILLVCNYTSGTSALIAWYDFKMAIAANGDITFTSFDSGGTDTQYGNGRNTAVAAGFKPLRDYLAGKVFKGDWRPQSAELANYQKFAGFTVKDDPTNYFYGKF